MKKYIRATKYYAVLDTKYVGTHKVEIKAKDDAEAKAKAKKLENENNKIVKLIKTN